MSIIIKVQAIDIKKMQLDEFYKYFQLTDVEEYHNKYVRCDLAQMIPYLFPSAHRLNRKGGISADGKWVLYVDKYEDDFDINLLRTFCTKVSVHKNQDDKGNTVYSLYNVLTNFSLIQNKKIYPLFRENLIYREYLDNNPNIEGFTDEDRNVIKSFTLLQLNDSIYANFLLELIDKDYCHPLTSEKDLDRRRRTIKINHSDIYDEAMNIINDHDNSDLNDIRNNMKVKVANMMNYKNSLEALRRLVGELDND